MTFQIQIHTVKCQSRGKIQTNQSTNVGMSESIFIPPPTPIPVKTSAHTTFHVSTWLVRTIDCTNRLLIASFCMINFPFFIWFYRKKRPMFNCSTCEHLIFVEYLQSTSSFHIMDWKYLCEMVDFSSPPSSLQTKWQQFPVKEVDFFLTIFPPRYWKTLLYKMEDWYFWNIHFLNISLRTKLWPDFANSYLVLWVS